MILVRDCSSVLYCWLISAEHVEVLGLSMFSPAMKVTLGSCVWSLCTDGFDGKFVGLVTWGGYYGFTI